MLGKTVILSDLAIHHEQAPDFAVYFDRNSAKDLTEKILDLLPRLSPGPDHAREQEAKKKSIELVKQFGRNFCSIAIEARRLFGKEVSSAFSSQPLSNKAYTANFPVLILKYPSSPRPSTRGNSLNHALTPSSARIIRIWNTSLWTAGALTIRSP